jgi:hypothetical protein
MCKNGKKELKYITDGLSNTPIDSLLRFDPMRPYPHDSSCLVWPGRSPNRVHARGCPGSPYNTVAARGIGDRDASVGLFGDPGDTTGNG